MASPMVQIQVTVPVSEAHKTVLTTEAVAFLKKLASEFEGRRQQLLAQRHERQARLDRGELPDFLPETAGVRKAEWSVASIPKDLLDRRVEITGPVDRKMIINALNCGAEVFMADFEDSNSPTWNNNLDGHVNLRDAVNRTISFVNPEGKSYKLNEKTATLLVRPRGWQADLRRPVRLWTVFLPQRQKFDRARNSALLLSSEAGEPSGSAFVERRFQFLPGLCWNSSRNRSRHGADRNDPCGV